MKKPIISICIPAYNHEKYIAHTITSILEQTFQDFEIIISDDNSSDGTIQIARNFKDPRIKIIENKENQGPSINSNITIKNASSNLIALIASDDMMKKDRLEKTFNFLNSNPNIDAVFTWAQTIDVNNEEINHKMMGVFNRSYSSKYKILNHFFYNGNFICAPSCLIKKEVLTKLGGFVPCLWQLQDFDMWIKILTDGFDIGFIKEKLTYYRIGNANLSLVGININANVNSKFLSRHHFEIEKILENFLKITDIEDFFKIFPKIKNKYQIIDQKYIAFYLMNEALEKAKEGDQSYKNFAISICYKLMNDQDMRNLLLENFNFKVLDFIDLVSNNLLIGNDKPRKNCIKRICDSFKKELKD